MRRMGFGLLLVGLVVVPQAAQPEDFFVSEPDLLTSQFIRSNTDPLSPYLFSKSVLLPRSADTAPVELGFSSTSRSHPVDDPRNETSRAPNTHWQLISISGDSRAALLPILRDDSKGEPLEIKPQRHSFWMVWRKALP